jgi:hypothetical protein
MNENSVVSLRQKDEIDDPLTNPSIAHNRVERLSSEASGE